MAVKLGIQLFSLRNKLAEDAVATLKKAFEIGYHYIEPANPRADQDPVIGYDIPEKDLKEIMGQYGAHICSAHLGPLSMETIPEIARVHKSLGNSNIVEAIMFFKDYDFLMRRCELYNSVGKYLVEHEMNPLIYHNHYHEYQMLGGKEILYTIMDNTDPAYLNFEIDTGWVKRAGRDPIAEMKVAGKRIRTIHIKDFSHTPPNLLIGKDDPISWETFGANNQPGDVMTPKDFVEVGTGMMDIQSILDTANELGVEYAILEQDDTAIDIFDSIAGSFENLKKYEGLEVQ